MSYRKQNAGTKRDFRQEVTDNIISALEKGVPPWQQGWDSAETLEMPRNPISGKPYHGGNVLNLMITAASKGYNDPRWVTYHQAQEKGWQIRRGEHGTQVEFWKMVNPEDDEPALDPLDDENRTRFIHRVYTVFNACQIDGVPEKMPTVRNDWEVIQSAESILKNSGAAIIHSSQVKAFYRKTTDTIHLPHKSAFHEAIAYYGTALHELAHWSGHRDRLNRETLTQSSMFGDPSYAREELRAELTSVFLMAERGIPCNLENNAAYIEHWLKSLQQDKNEIFRAARDAHKAADFLFALELHQSPDKALAAVKGHQPAVETAPVAEPEIQAARSLSSPRETVMAAKTVAMEM
jgi:antirestriction protein ArdC